MAKRVSDETLLETLLIHGGVKGAACVLSLSENAIYKRLQNPEFREQYDKLQGVVLSTVTAKMAIGLEKAVNSILSILDDSSTSAGLRLQAANALLSHCAKYVDTSIIMRRLDALETEIEMRDKSNE